MTTIRAVAKEANVSPSTVSLVLNGRGRVSKATQQRVFSVMQRLRYEPQRAGRRPAAERKHHIGIVYTAHVVSHGVLTQLTRAWITGIRAGLRDAGDEPSVFGGAAHVDDDLMLQQVLEADEVDGIILIGPTAGDGYLDQIMAAGIPTVVLNRQPKHAEFSYVVVDNHGGGRQAMEHLHEQGHQHLAMIYSGRGDADMIASRCQGARTAAAALGIRLDPIVCAGDVIQDVDVLHNACRQVARSKATGVFITADHVAGECIACWKTQNIDPLERWSIVGFDDLGIDVGNGRKLSSVGFDKHHMGHQAATLMRQLLMPGSQTVSAGLTIATEVVDYDTVSPCRGRTNGRAAD